MITLFDLKDVRPKGFKRTRRVNGEKVIEFTAIPFEENKSTFDLIVEEASVNALGDKYIIKKLTEQSRGKTYIKNVTAIHKFFVDLINKQQPKIHNGSITFNNYMNLVFEDTPYTFVAIDHFPAREFENLGNDNRLALLQKGLDRFQAEFELVGNQVRFYKQIGNDTDFQFRYGHNIKAINVDIDTTNLATRIRGTGDHELGIEAEYTSPNSAIYGIIDAPPVNDERFKSEETLLEEMKRRLIDEPEISITVDFVDLRAAGYPYTVPNEGDRVWLIYEPMNDLLIETRIMEIVEYFKYDETIDEFVVIKTEVTLSNDKKTFAGTMFDNVRKQLREIVNDDGIIRYSALDEAVKIATEALHRAQTELIFENGIIARDKNNPNRLVLFNSEGIGISDDGGHTFREAITADGFVLTAGAIGRLSANHIQIGSGTEFEPNYDPSTKETPQGAQNKASAAENNAKSYADGKDSNLREDLRLAAPLPTSITMNNNGIRASAQGTNRYAQLDYRGMFIKGGAISIERPDGAVWMQDGMVHKDYDISGQDPHFMGEVSTPGGYEPAFQQMPGSGGYYGAHTGVIDGSEPYSEDIRDQSKGYTVNFQRYWFMHSSRYFILRFQPSVRTNGLERLRVRMYEGDTPLLTQDIESSGFGSWYPLVVDLGKPTYTERRIDFRIGFLRQWKIPNYDAIVFRISRTYQTDFI